MAPSVTLALAAFAASVSSAELGWNELGAHAGFPVARAQPGGTTFTYMSVTDPDALNLDGSRYGIAVCLSSVSKANWTFSTDGVSNLEAQPLPTTSARHVNLANAPNPSTL
jgi:hypothetical protein